MSRLFGRFLEKRDTTFQQVWGADTDNPASPWNANRSVTRDSALGLSAVFACVRLIADTISTLPFKEYTKDGERRIEVDPQPEWIARPIPRDPSVTKEVHLAQVVTSLLLEGNSFTFVAPDILNPVELRVLDPRRVEIKRQPDGSKLFKVTNWNGQPAGEFDWTQIIHIPLLTLPGELRGVSPLEAERLTFLGAVSAEELAANFLHNGNWMSAMVEMPPTAPPLTKEGADKLIGEIEKKWTGSRRAGKVGILTGGATLRQLSVTPEQAQFLQTRQYDDERIFRIFRCPPALVGMTREGAVSYASSVMQDGAFGKHTIRPPVRLIESGYRVLVVPGNYLKATFGELLAPDPLTRAQIHHYALTDKWRIVNEVRGIEDLDPFDGKDGGLLETPNNNAPGLTPPLPTRSEPQIDVHVERVSVDDSVAGAIRATVQDVVQAEVGIAAATVRNAATDLRETSENWAETQRVLADDQRTLAEEQRNAAAADTAKLATALETVAAAQRAPRKRRLERDAEGQIVGVVDYVKE